MIIIIVDEYLLMEMTYTKHELLVTLIQCVHSWSSNSCICYFNTTSFTHDSLVSYPYIFNNYIRNSLLVKKLIHKKLLFGFVLVFMFYSLLYQGAIYTSHVTIYRFLLLKLALPLNHQILRYSSHEILRIKNYFIFTLRIIHLYHQNLPSLE